MVHVRLGAIPQTFDPGDPKHPVPHQPPVRNPLPPLYRALQLLVSHLGCATGSAPLEPPHFHILVSDAKVVAFTTWAPSVLHYDPLASTNLGCPWSPRPCGALGHAERGGSSARTPF